jgi:anti-anti-sigma factor
MLIRTWSLDEITVLDVTGRLGVEDGVALYRSVGAAVAGGSRQLVLNLAHTTAIDAAGLGELVRAYTAVREANGTLALVVRARPIRELLLRTRLLWLVPTYFTEAEAIASFDVPQPV